MSQLSVSVLVFEAFSNMVLACLLEPLRVVRDETGADITWRILTETDGPLDSSSGLSVTPDGPIAAAPPADLVLLVGGDRFRGPLPDRGFGRRLGALIRGATVIAADTGSWVLARHGHLDGRRATLHWQLLSEFAETFPAVETVAEPAVRDGRFWSCGGAAAGLDLILDFIRERFGPAAAFDAGAMFLHDGGAASSVEAPKPALASTAPPALHAALRAMSDALEQPLSVADLAHAAGMSERSYHRLFQRELKTTPARYYTMCCSGSPAPATSPGIGTSACGRSRCAAASPMARRSRGASAAITGSPCARSAGQAREPGGDGCGASFERIARIALGAAPGDTPPT